MALKWSDEASKAAADLINEKSSLDYALFAVPNPKKPELVVESKGNGGRQAVFDFLSCDEASPKILTGAFVVSAVEEKGSVQSVRRKLVHLTFAGSQVGIIAKGKVNGWSGQFRDKFPGCATYLQLMGGDLDDLQEGDLEATLMAGGGATRFDFSNQTLRGSLDVQDLPAPAPAPAPVVSSGGKRFKKPVAPAPVPVPAAADAPKPTPAPAPAPPQKLTKTQTALQKMKEHKDAMRRRSAASTPSQPVPPPSTPPAPKKAASPPERPVLRPVTVQEKEPTTTTPPSQSPVTKPTTSGEDRDFLMLLSTQSGSNKQSNDIKSSKQILKSIGVEPVIVDGADPSSKKRRDELFRLSGIRGNYPQFFVVQRNSTASSSAPTEDESETSFFGDFEVLNEKKQNGTLAKDIGLGSDHLRTDQEENSENSAGNKKLILLISSMCNARVLAEQNHAKAVIEGLGIDTTSQLELLDGCDQQMRDRRNELWGVSGMRAQYPQLFTVEDGGSKIQFVGNYENIMYLHDHGSLAQEIGLSA